MKKMMSVNEINEAISYSKENDENFSAKDISDKYHTFGDLYHGRMIMSALICNTYSHLSWKSKQHHPDDKNPMFDDSFLVCTETPEGPYSNHYPLKDWDKFDVIELEHARPWDGHTADDIGRLLSLLNKDQ